jgi:hypothetical protein
MNMSDTTQQAENLVNYLESQREIIREAQNGYKNAKTHEDKVSVMSNFLTQKAQLRTAAPPRDSKCLFSIGPGTAITIATTIAAG